MLKCGKGNFSPFYKVLFIIILVSGSLLIPIASYADLPGDCGDPNQDPTQVYTCPLDTWVWALAVIAVIFGALYLQRTKKLQSQQ